MCSTRHPVSKFLVFLAKSSLSVRLVVKSCVFNILDYFSTINQYGFFWVVLLFHNVSIDDFLFLGLFSCSGVCDFLPSANWESLTEGKIDVGIKGESTLLKVQKKTALQKYEFLICDSWFITLCWFTAYPSSVWARTKAKKEQRRRFWSENLLCLSDSVQTTVKTDGGPDTHSDIGKDYKRVGNESCSFLCSVFDRLFQLVSISFSCYVAITYKLLCVTAWFICGSFSLSVQTTMQLGSIMLSEWHGDVAGANEQQGQPQHLGLSRLTKGSHNCFSQAADCTVAVNVTDTMVGVFQTRSWGAGGREEPLKVAAPRLTGAARSAPSQALSQLGFPVAFAPLCQLSESVRTKRLLQQLSGKTLLHSDQCLHKRSSSAYCLDLVNHSYDLWSCSIPL